MIKVLKSCNCLKESKKKKRSDWKILKIILKCVSSYYIQPLEYIFHFILLAALSVKPCPLTQELRSSRRVSPTTYACFLSAHWLHSFACFQMDFEIFTAGWALSLIALNPHLSQAKLTAADSPSPFRLFSRNDSVLTDALAEERKRGEKIVSKRPCFINVNMVTGQNDQSHSSIHDYYSATKKEGDKEQKGRGRKVQTGSVRWTALGNGGSIKFVISNTLAEVTIDDDTALSPLPLFLSVSL